MNGLLLAEEFRSLIMSQAFDLSTSIPENFQWEFLEYHTTNSDNENLPIRNLNHLKQVILEENSSNVLIDIENEEEYSTQKV